MPLNDLISAQAAWAKERWPGHDGPRAPSLEENLICPFSTETRLDYESCSGYELGGEGRPGKMSSLRSSSALAYNVFEPWKGQDLQPLASALKASVASQTLRFEQKYAHGLETTPPNIDVVLDHDQERPLGIECKFTEPYGRKHPRPPLAAKYFKGNRRRWSEVGLPQAQLLASTVGTESIFHRLDVGQLLEHLLGLATATGRVPRLCYLWFDSGCREAFEHRAELDQFADYLNPCIDFNELTYQELMGRLSEAAEPMPRYRAYLTERYFKMIDGD